MTLCVHSDALLSSVLQKKGKDLRYLISLSTGMTEREIVSMGYGLCYLVMVILCLSALLFKYTQREQCVRLTEHDVWRHED